MGDTIRKLYMTICVECQEGNIGNRSRVYFNCGFVGNMSEVIRGERSLEANVSIIVG